MPLVKTPLIAAQHILALIIALCQANAERSEKAWKLAGEISLSYQGLGLVASSCMEF
jgi:hypothetical protein